MSPANTAPRISDERTIANLMSEYAYVNDDANISALGDLFADAVFTLDGTSVSTRAEMENLASSIITTREDGRSTTTHEVTNLLIDIDPTTRTAVGRAYWTVYRTISGQPRQALISGRYKDRFVGANGSWRFAERNAETLWRLDSPSA